MAHLFNEEIRQPGRIILAEDKEDMEMVELIKEVAEDMNIRGVRMLDRGGSSYLLRSETKDIRLQEGKETLA